MSHVTLLLLVSLTSSFFFPIICSGHFVDEKSPGGEGIGDIRGQRKEKGVWIFGFPYSCGFNGIFIKESVSTT